jgi:hypothetical protein
MTDHDTDPTELVDEHPTAAECPVAKSGCRSMRTLTDVMLDFVADHNQWKRSLELRIDSLRDQWKEPTAIRIERDDRSARVARKAIRWPALIVALAALVTALAGAYQTVHSAQATSPSRSSR